MTVRAEQRSTKSCFSASVVISFRQATAAPAFAFACEVYGEQFRHKSAAACIVCFSVSVTKSFRHAMAAPTCSLCCSSWKHSELISAYVSGNICCCSASVTTPVKHAMRGGDLKTLS